MQLVVTPAGHRSLAALPAARGLPAPAGAAGAAGAGGSERPLVVIHAGATNGAAKRWPAAYWSWVAARLVADGVVVALAGGPEDRPLAQEIRQRAGRDVIDLAGATSLPALLALLERASVVASGDSGPMHLAVALGRPTVAIHGPTDPAISGPYDRSRATVVRHDLPCSPCSAGGDVRHPGRDRPAECPLGHTLCQRLIAPETVYRAIRAALNTHACVGASPASCAHPG